MDKLTVKQFKARLIEEIKEMQDRGTLEAIGKAVLDKPVSYVSTSDGFEIRKTRSKAVERMISLLVDEVDDMDLETVLELAKSDSRRFYENQSDAELKKTFKLSGIEERESHE